MRAIVVELPDVAEGVAEAEIAEWRVAVDDIVARDQVLAAVVTDKATVEIPSPASGRVVKLGAAIGEMLRVGAPLVVLDPQTEVERDIAPRGDSRPGSSPTQIPHAAALTSGTTRTASPASFANGAKSAAIASTGGEGATPRSPKLSKDETREGSAREIEIGGERLDHARRLSAIARTVPQFSCFDEVDMTACEELRGRLNAKWAAARGELTTPTFVIRAIVVALRDHPEMNARHDDARGILLQSESVDIGVSLGASAPVLRDAGSLTLWECEAEMRALAATAAEGSLDSDEPREPTITIASLGEFGGLAMFPVIAAGEVAIIGVNRLAIRPSWREDRFAPRKMMNLTGAFDQRVIPPREAGRFIAAIKQLLESPAELFIEP